MGPINEAELYEKAGVWIYSPDIEDVKTSHQQQAEYIYTYIRETIAKSLNKNPSAENILMRVPDELLGVDITLKNREKIQSKLYPLKVFYSPNSSNYTSMETDCTGDTLLMKIYIPITSYDFKESLFHELKHCWQFIYESGKFEDDVFFNMHTNSNISIPIKKFIDCVYRINPREFSSYRENVYRYAYEKYIYWQNAIKTNKKTYKDKNSLVKHIKRAYSYHSDIVSFLNKVSLQYNKDIKLYVLYLFLSSLPGYNGETYYDLFSSKVYFNEISKQLNQVLIETFKGIPTPSNEANCSKFLRKFAEKLYTEQELDDFIDILVKDIIDNLKKYIDDYQHKIDKVINLAFQDAEKYINRGDDEIHLNNSSLYNYTLYYSDSEYGVEVVFTYDNEKYIGILKDVSIRNCMMKMCLLYKLYTNSKLKISVEFLYKLFLNAAASYIYHNITLERLKAMDYPKFKSIADCEKIFNYINDIDIDNF